MNCQVCIEASHGAWPRWHQGTHCRDCHRSWSTKSAAHAMCCHRTFSSNSAADMHLVRGVCTDPATLPRFEVVVRADGNECWMPRIGVETLDSGRETALPAV